MLDWRNGRWGLGDWVVMSAMMILLWGALIALLVWAVPSMRSGRRREQGAAGHAQRVLAQRFARGEIDSKEFSRARELLLDDESVSAREAR